MPTSRCGCRPPNCCRNAHRTCWPASTRCSPRATGRRQDRRRSATSCAMKACGSRAKLCSLMPDERDAQALAALVLLHDSRRQTRVDADGALVPLDEQDRSRWDRGRIARGLDRLAAGRRRDRSVSAAGGDRGAARDGAELAADRLGDDLRGLRPADRDHRLPRCPGEPRAGDRLPRRVRGGPGGAGRGGRRPDDWPGRTPWHRSAPICCVAPAGATRRSGGIASRWTATAPDPAREFLRRRLAECGAGD